MAGVSVSTGIGLTLITAWTEDPGQPSAVGVIVKVAVPVVVPELVIPVVDGIGVTLPLAREPGS